MPVLGVCYPSYSPPDTMVHLRCLKNSALQLSRALRKYFLSLVQQQSEMPNMVKKACGTGGGEMKSNLPEPVQRLNYVILSLPHLKFVS